MVHRCPGARAYGDISRSHGDARRLEQWRIDHPAERPGVLVDQPDFSPNLEPRSTEQGLRKGARTGSKEDAIAWCGTDLGSKSVAFRIREVLGYRSAKLPIFADQNVRQAAVSSLPGELLPRIQLPTRLTGTPRHDHSADVLRLKHPKRCLSEVPGELDNLLPEPQIRLVSAEAVQRVGVGEPWQGRHDVELGEVGLPIRPEVFVAIAPGDLVVALHTGHHEQLLEQLGTLRQRIPGARL